jgi:selenide,water dikinase
VKLGRATAAQTRAVGETMAALNRAAAARLHTHDAHAVTDVTGFGLVGHAMGIARESRAVLEFRFADLPLLDGALEAAGGSRSRIPGGTWRNLDAYGCCLDLEAADSERVRRIVCDPQTSGGLLVALPAAKAQAYVKACDGAGVRAAVVGRVLEGGEKCGRVTVR